MDYTKETTQALQQATWHYLNDAIEVFELDYAHELAPGMHQWPDEPWQPETLTAWYEATCTAFDDVYGLVDHFASPSHAALRYLHTALANLQEVRRRIELARVMHAAKAAKRALAV